MVDKEETMCLISNASSTGGSLYEGLEFYLFPKLRNCMIFIRNGEYNNLIVFTSGSSCFWSGNKYTKQSGAKVHLNIQWSSIESSVYVSQGRISHSDVTGNKPRSCANARHKLSFFPVVYRLSVTYDGDAFLIGSARSLPFDTHHWDLLL